MANDDTSKEAGQTITISCLRLGASGMHQYYEIDLAARVLRGTIPGGQKVEVPLRPTRDWFEVTAA